MKIGLSISGIEQVREQFERAAQAPQQALDATAVKLEEYIDTQLARHTKTGALERSLGKRRIAAGWEIGHGSRVAPHALWVHGGTKPHMIFPKEKKALRWVKGGFVGPMSPIVNGKALGRSGFVFSMGVKHPGTAPDKWMDRAAAQAPLIFRAQLQPLLPKV